ncbi:MAG: vanadium-dependent haloperoxidase [Aetokthonos hydrillicola CCALA 1050]|nr:vanadium-dependent haloperoxidase [Aetokthonos hydrillicola CCALA 1050]MBW4590358.1 vanadium-dependent haloperoxidase [Aetokthonos hydrillicola CCALA 1050]
MANSSQNQATTTSKRSIFSRGRRAFLGRAGLLTATATGIVSGAIASPFSGKKRQDIVQAKDIVGLVNFDYAGFSRKAYDVRIQAARQELDFGVPPHPTNGDEERYPNKIATDTRGLPHNERGEVNLDAYKSFIKALQTRNPDDFENIILGGTRKLVSPQGPLALSLLGLNAAQIQIPVPPTLDSAEQAGEAVELYWQALLRDVSFEKFQDNTDDPKVLAAVEDINKLSVFGGPKQNGRVTPQTLFRGSVNYVDSSTGTARYVTPPGILDGPYISQFLLLNIPFNTQFISPLIRTALPGNDFLTSFDEWLTIQNGGSSGRAIKYDSTRRYISTVRDLGEYVHIGGASYLGALLILSSGVNQSDPVASGIGAPFSPTNPYNNSKTQAAGVGSFAAGYFQALLLLAPSLAIRASYWQKYYVHRRLRPEAYGGLIYNNLVNKTQYPINSEVLNSRALAQTSSTFNTYLLPQAYPEASPTHSSYSGGAAVVAGVSVTLLKAFFDENFVIPNPVQPDPKDPTKVIPYTGKPLTVGGELNKLATNYAIGRSFGGIHWRSDGSAALALGEEVAISILRDEKLGYNEKFSGYTFTKFDGTKITI